MKIEDPAEHNREAWNRYAASGNKWTIGATSEEIARAKSGDPQIVLTPQKLVPKDWLGDLFQADVLGLASGGGQQGPLLAAAGANVTVFDASEAQLETDRLIAEREALRIRTVLGDMRDLSAFEDESFDIIVHPCSNCFVEDIQPVWREAHRVLRPRGRLLTGFTNPIVYSFDWATVEAGEPRLRYKLPYRDVDHLDDPYVAKLVEDGEAVMFAHTFEQQIAGQLDAGFLIAGFYEDEWSDEQFPNQYFPGFFATFAVKNP